MDRTRWLKGRDFDVVLLDVPPAELRRRDALRLERRGGAETWTALQHFIGDVVTLSTNCADNDADVIAHFLFELTEAINHDTRRQQRPNP